MSPAAGLRWGAYVLLDPPEGAPELTLVGTGSEVSLIVEAARVLVSQGIKVRVVSMPSWDLFEAQPRDYRENVLPASIPCLAVEAGSPQGWHRYVGCHGDVLGIERFGASAPGPTALAEYGFTVDNVCQRAMRMLGARS